MGGLRFVAGSGFARLPRMGTDQDILVELTTSATDFDAEVVAAALRDAGIHAAVFSRATSMLQGSISPLNSITVSVRRGDLDRARVVLADVRQAAREIDWSQVDTQDRSPVSPEELAGDGDGRCPFCGDARGRQKRTEACPGCGRVPDVAASTAARTSASPRSRTRRVRRVLKVGIALLLLYAVYLVLATLMQR